MADPWAMVRAVTRQARSSFLWGMRALPRSKRRAIYAVYAFARSVDDIVDGALSTGEKLQALSAWREEIDRLYEGAPRHPIAVALAEGVRQFHLPREEFCLLLQGMEADAQARVRVPSLGDLFQYCRCVAGSVGVLCVHIFGLPTDRGIRFAIALGCAFQITNILRDITEDAARDRLYVPEEMLAHHSAVAVALSDLVPQRGFAAACLEMADIAEAQYHEAAQLMQTMSWWRTRPPAFMIAVYQATLKQLRARGWARLDVPVRPRRMERLWLVARKGWR